MRPRSALADEISETDAKNILGTIAVAAHALTGANGAAIAMPRGGEVVCVGRSGEIAPELGDLLNVDSGISGECLRTGRIMRCDDASRDFHVDADVCRHLNLQSIAVVPLRGRQGRVGVLETFSNRSYAFTEEHMEMLGRLAGLAEAAWAQAHEEQKLGTARPAAPPPEAAIQHSSVGQPGVRQPLSGRILAPQSSIPPSVIQEPVAKARPKTQPRSPEWPAAFSEPVAVGTPAASRLSRASEALARASEAISMGLRAQVRNERRWRYWLIAGAGTVLLFLLMVLGWRAWYRASLPTRTTGSPHGSAVSANPDGATVHGTALEPGTNPSLSQSSSALMVRHSATHKAFRRWSRVRGSSATAKLVVKNGTVPDQVTTAEVETPEMPASDGAVTDLGGLPPASPALPKLTVPISQGISGGHLVHRVQPVYPSEARQLNLKGTVVLAGSINENGQIEDLKLVSGSPLLAGAAMDAVRKWRYSPYLLNGKPIRKETEINITFIPQ